MTMMRALSTEYIQKRLACQKTQQSVSPPFKGNYCANRQKTIRYNKRKQDNRKRLKHYYFQFTLCVPLSESGHVKQNIVIHGCYIRRREKQQPAALLHYPVVMYISFYCVCTTWPLV